MYSRKTTLVGVVLIFCILSITQSNCKNYYQGLARDSLLSNNDKHGVSLSLGWIGFPSPFIVGRPLTTPRRGIVTTPAMGPFLTAALQPDGKIVAAGGNGRVFKLVRYQPDGSLDPAFGNGGIAETQFFDPLVTNFEAIAAIVIQPDGKILCGGTAAANVRNSVDYNRYDFALARYNPDGSLDTTFGTGGKLLTDIFSTRADVITSLALLPDGKFIAAGFSGAPQTPIIRSDFVVARYNSNGSIDTTFGTSGMVVTDFANDSDVASSLAIQPDGKLIVGGFAYNTASRSDDFALARYNANGSLDSAFGSGGKVLIDLSNSVTNDPGDDLMTSMALQPDGKILCAGSGELNRQTTASDFMIARFNPSGSLDATFGTGGKVTTDFNKAVDEGFSLALLPDGKFVVVGMANGILFSTLQPNLFPNRGASLTIQAPRLSDFAVARYNPDGSLDKSFGTGGKGETDVFSDLDMASKVLIMPNGNILALGLSTEVNGGGFTSIAGTSVMFKGTVLQRRKLNDFDGDGIAEFAVFRPSDASWRYVTTNLSTIRNVQFGISTDKPVAGDYDGDGHADIAVFRNGSWNIVQSSDGATRVLPLGQAGDMPVQDDYDGDGQTDIAVWRPSNGTWYWQNSGNGQFGQAQSGQSGDIPVNGDYDADGKSDLSYFHPADGTWHRINSSNGASGTVSFGASGDKPVVGDYDGDGIFDLAVFRPSDQTWRIRKSSDGTSTTTTFGLAADIPVPADYDGDQLTDIAVFRPSDGTWRGLKSSGGTFTSQFGVIGDIPIPSTDFVTTVVTPVAISGRVTTPSGLGLRNAVVSLIDQNGMRRTAATSSFGIYSFATVMPGQTYTITVSSKRYRYSPVNMPVNDTITNLDFVGLE